MGKTVFDDTPPQGTIVTATFLNKLNNQRHTGRNVDGEGVLDYAVATGSANAYAITLTPALDAHIPGMPIRFKANFTNTGAATLNVNGLGAVPLRKKGSFALVSGDIPAGQIIDACYDGAVYQISTASLGSVEIDALYDYGSGSSFTDTTIIAALAAIGTSAPATVLLRPGTWVISADRDWSAYTNVVFKLPKGAVINYGSHSLKLPFLDAGHYLILTGTGSLTLQAGQCQYVDWIGITAGSDYPTIQNKNAVRWPHNFNNFLANSGMESWSLGANQPPDCWQVYGATCARSSNAASGVYSAALSFTANGQSFWNSIGAFGRYGRYTFSGYYQRTAGSGGCSAVIQLGQPPYAEYFTLDLDGTIDGEWKLFTVSGELPVGAWGLPSKFGFNSRGDNASTWLFDECMVQEGLNFASSWTPAPLWDSGGGQHVLQALYFAYWNLFGFSPGTLPTAFVDILGEPGLRIRNSTPPTTASSPGNKGQIEWDADNIYICINTNSWISIPRSDAFKTGSNGAKAWVNFNGTGTVAVRAGYNVTSVTDNGVGDYTINFLTALSDANYALAGSAQGAVHTGNFNNYPSPEIGLRAGAVPSNSSCRIQVSLEQGGDEPGTNPYDSSYVNVVFFR